MRKIIILIVAVFILSNLNLFNYNEQLSQLKQKVKTNKTYNQKYAFIIDYGLHSSLDRGVLIDLSNKKKVFTFKVANGRGKSKRHNFNPQYSNKISSNNSSLGYAVLSDRGVSSWGIKINYKMDGLSETNSNIRRRNIVLHSWEGIPKYSIFPIPLPQSQGCPTVSNSDMRKINLFIQSQKNKKILIYFINEKK